MESGPSGATQSEWAGAEPVEPEPAVGTPHRPLLHVGYRRAATAAAAVVLSAAAIASPGVVRRPQPVAAAAAQAHEAATAPVVVPEPASTESAAPAPAPSAPLVVRLASSRLCWVRVTVDGRAEELMLAAGDEITRSAEGTIRVRIGDAAAVTLDVNGRELPPLGRNGQVVDRTFTADTVAQ